MKTKAFSLMLASTLIALAGASVPFNAGAEEGYFTHPSSCVAPYLSQAALMRWHEHFLLNPSSGVTTWVICPIDMSLNELDPSNWGNWVAQVYLQKTADASPQEPLCYLTVHSVLNQKWGSFIDGPSRTYTAPLQNSTSGGITVAQAPFSPLAIIPALGAGAEAYPFNVSVFCRLDPGWGLNGAELMKMLSR
jgi:hypothetical protein